MLHRIATFIGVCLLIATATAPQVLADPPADPSVAPVANAGPVPEPPNAPMPSGTPGTLTTPDGWVLAVSAKDESIEPVASLTNSPWSRE